jgi:hypothetical protein
VDGIVNSTSDNTLWSLHRSYFKGISANIERRSNKKEKNKRKVPKKGGLTSGGRELAIGKT